MKKFRQAIGSILRKVRRKPSKSTSVVCEDPLSNLAGSQQTPSIPMASQQVPHYRINSECITIFVTTGGQSSYASTVDCHSNRSTDASPYATASSATSVGTPSISADQCYKAELAALGLAMKLPLAELSLIASDSNFLLSSGEPIKEADFCALKASPESIVDESSQDHYRESRFDIFEEKRGPSDIVLPKAVPISTAGFDTQSPPPTKPIEPYPSHPAFLSNEEFAALPHYEDIEDDPAYDIFYTRTNKSFSSIASLSSYISTMQTDSSWLAKIRTGIDIGGVLYFLEKGVKRKASVKVSSAPTTKREADDEEEIECPSKRRDCRIREMGIAGRVGGLYPSGYDAEWHDAHGYEVIDGESDDENALMTLVEFLESKQRNAYGFAAWDDGYGGYGHEIF